MSLLRMVSVSNFKPGEGDWEGMFHAWGVDFMELGHPSDGNYAVGTYTIALIEDSEGKIHKIAPDLLVFLHDEAGVPYHPVEPIPVSDVHIRNA